MPDSQTVSGPGFTTLIGSSTESFEAATEDAIDRAEVTIAFQLEDKEFQLEERRSGSKAAQSLRGEFMHDVDSG